jgi:UDP-N-acetylmuramoyl-tripeptide--D-alanyl-D-alanine ligase
MMTLAQAHALLPASTLIGDGAIVVRRVHSDTRTLRTGDLFVALKGERFDGHDMLVDAKAKGAVAGLAQRGLADAGLPGLQVPDTQQALEQLATAWRGHFYLPLIAVTGSNGKTTVTQMIASILRAWLGDGAFATEGNLNNHIGVPLTLLRLRQDGRQWHRAGVVELGMNHPGEIALLAKIAQPTIALVNNAQREHQEFMASVEAVARENGAAIEALGASGTAIYPADDDHAPLWHQLAGARPQLTFALQGAADFTTDALWVSDESGDHWALVLHTPAGSTSLALRAAGRHNVSNALAATACALAAGAPLAAVKRGLEAFEPIKGRSQMKRVTLHGLRIELVDDSYNANPDSVRAAIDVLAAMHAPRLLLLGDMGEVGDRGPAFHAEVGAYARERGIDHLWCVGPQSADAARAFGSQARHFADVPALIVARADLPAAASVLVKGSRFMAMERVVDALTTTENA